MISYLARFTYSSQLFPELKQDSAVSTLTLLGPCTSECRKAELGVLTKNNGPASIN